MKFKFLLILILALAINHQSKAQIEVIDTLTVEELVYDYFLGEGVFVSNVTFNGLPADSVYMQIGLYESNENSLVVDFDTGLVMASSDAKQLIVNGLGVDPPDTENSGSGFDDPDLVTAAGQPINDAAILEFDFVTVGDSINFDYIFGSIEYPGFTCSDYNDVFGFYLSGPGINGPFENNAVNLALIPGSDIPVAINTVNSGVASNPDNGPVCEAANPNWIEDSQYFVPNDPPGVGDVQLPGLTQTFVAASSVIPCETYHIKMAIGDAFDGILNSAVVLKAGSFELAGDLQVDAVPTIGGAPVTTPEFADVLVPGCSTVSIEITKPNCLPADTAYISYGGTAEEGLGNDYVIQNGADTLQVFPADQDTLEISFEILWDGVPGENEVLEIYVVWVNLFGELDTVVTSIPFVDPYEISSTTSDLEIFCPTDFVDVTAQGLDGIDPYTYNWIDYGNSQTVPVPVPIDQAYYLVAIQDACAFETIYDSVLVTNSIPPPLQTAIAPFVQPECPNQPIDLTALIQDGNPPYNIIWTDDQNNGYVPAETITVADINQSLLGFSPNLEVDLTILDSCGTMVSDSVVINYPLPDSLWVTYPPLTDNCPEDPVSITANTNGGSGENEYTWSFVQGSENGAEFVPQGANYDQTVAADFAAGMNELQVMVTDKCFRANQDMIGIIFSEDGQTTTYRTGMSLYTDSVPIIKLDPLPNVITPNNDRYNDYFVVAGIETFDNARLEVYDRWGKLVFETDNYEVGSPEMNPLPEDVFDGADLSEGTYFYIVNIDNGECTQSGELQILKSDN